jgi:hypothetical protein
MIGWTPVLAIYGGIHGLIAVLLAGRTMADRFDMQAAWRERYGMDEYGVARLRKTVTRASASLPSVILYFLGPKEPGQDMLVTALALAAGALAVGGLAGVVRMRTWGVMALGAASATLLPFATHAVQSAAALEVGGQTFAWAMGAVVLGPGLPAALLAFAVLPFAIPAVRYLRRRG